MEFLDSVIDTAQKAGKFIYDKTSGAVDYVTLEYKCSELKTKIDEYYKALGQFIYENAGNEQDTDGKKASIISKIDELKNELSLLYEQMSKYKTICPNCKNTNSGKAEFCSKCGTSLK